MEEKDMATDNIIIVATVGDMDYYSHFIDEEIELGVMVHAYNSST
jgi:hypothetical protein